MISVRKRSDRRESGFFCGLVIAVLVNILPAAAQVTQPLRFELEHKGNAFEYTVLPMERLGISMIHQVNKWDSGKSYWEVILLDTALQKTWAVEIKLDNDYTLIGHDYAEKHVYFLFRKGNSATAALHLLKISPVEHLFSEYEIEPKVDFRLTHYIMVGNSALLGGYIARQPAVFLYDLNTRLSKIVPGFLIKNTELIDLRSNHNGTFNVLMMDRSSTEKNKLVIRTMDESGVLIVDENVEVDLDKTILTGLTSTLVRDEMLIAGTWGASGAKTAYGIFTLVVDPFHQQAIKYYSFSELGNFLDLFVPKKAKRIRSASVRRKKDGKLPSYSIYVNAAKLTETTDGFLLLSEVYTPSGSNSNWSYYNPAASPYGYGNSYYPYGYNSPYGYNNRYSPYSYGNSRQPQTDVSVRFSAVTLFNAEGKFLEDTGQKIDDIKLPAMDQVSDFIISRDKFVQVYRNEKELYISTSQRGENGKTELESQPIRLKSPTDVLRSESTNDGTMRHWYDHNMIFWGYETVREQNGTRHVFYINAIRINQ